MQIHEITKRQKLDEIDLSAIKNAFASVNPTAAAKAVKSSMYGTTPKEPKWEDKYKEVETNPEVKKYIQRLMAGWKQVEPKQPATTPIQEVTQPNIMIGSEVIKPTDPRYAKLSAAATPTSTNSATPPVPPAATADPYKDAFEKWANQQIMSRDSLTGKTITAAEFKNLPGLDDKLTTALSLIAQTRGTPQQAKNIEEYLKLAVAGIQTIAAKNKNDALKSGRLTGLSARPTGNPKADALLRQVGYDVQ
jgi:hypothetical protein